MSFAEGLIGVVLDGRYRLDAVLGEGGMGSVFRATHVALDRKVAVKLLKPHLTSDDNALQRFAAEARRTMRVDSPHAVKVLDFGVTEARDYYMVLEYLDGRTVQRELEVDGPFAPARVIHIARQALSALGAAHASGLVHRDMKPDNILLMRAGDDPDFTKVLDFGVAKLMEGAAMTSRSKLQLTQQGMVFGTPEFMSPEQACGLALDGRSDIYALAATMFAMLTGCGLFVAGSAIEWLTHHARTPPPHLAQANVALADQVALDALLQQCLAKRPDQRPKDAAELDARLAELEGGAAAAIPATPPSPSRALGTIFSPSSYIEAIPADGPRASGLGPRPDGRGLMRPPTTDGAEEAPRRRGVTIALVSAATLVIVGAVVAIVAVSRSTGEWGNPGLGPRASGLGPNDTAVALAVVDANVAVVMVDAAAAPVDATIVAVAVDASPAPVATDAAVATAHPVAPRPATPATPTAPKVNPEVAKYLDNARAAQKANNRLSELSQAQAAWKLDPTNAWAAYLMGDALIATGDLDRGCQILGNIKGFPLATQRKHTGGCPN